MFRMRQQIIRISRAVFGWPPASASLEEKEALISRIGQEHGLKVFVETGTFHGDMIQAQREHFDKLISIELSEALFQGCSARFAGDVKVQLHQGDSGIKLGEVACNLDQTALFWLDAHYSRGDTAGAGTDAPILRELSGILPRNQPKDAILIDDARLFGLKSDYPKLETIRAFAARSWPNHEFSVQSDVICIVPMR